MHTAISKDGTPIAYEKFGKGPAVILVDGAFCSRKFGPMVKLAPVLAESFTVYAYDRRARGDSGDSKPYSIEREIEDIQTLISLAGCSAFLFGISSGAILCIHAAAAGLNISKMALFEPPYVGNKDGRRPADSAEQLTRLIAVDKRAAAVRFYLTKVIGIPAIIGFILRLTPNWPKMKANARSLPYDAMICGDFNLPEKQLSSIITASIVIDSKQSPDVLRKAVQAVAEMLPVGHRVSLKGNVHGVPPNILAPVLTKFFKTTLSTERSIVIRAPAASIWDVLTDPGKIRLYLFGSHTSTDWKVGSPITFSRDSVYKGAELSAQPIVDKGHVLEVKENEMLKYSYFSSQEGYEDIPENYSIITYMINQEKGGEFRLTYLREKIPIEFEQKNQEKFLPGMLELIKKIAEQGGESKITEVYQ